MGFASNSILNDLLTERNQYPDRAERIDESIRRTFEKDVAVLILDMCGFTQTAQRHGIIHFLAMIHQMEEAATPAVLGNGGEVLKQEADNLYAIFPTPADALEGAIDIFRSFSAMNVIAPHERDIHGSIGIGFGKTLVVGRDFFGSEVNLACKLGEDLAGAGEILLTPAAHELLPRDRYPFAPARYEVSGMQIECFRFQQVWSAGS